MRPLILLVTLAGCASQEADVVPGKPTLPPQGAVAESDCEPPTASSQLDKWGFPTVKDIRCRSRDTLQKPRTANLPEPR